MAHEFLNPILERLFPYLLGNNDKGYGIYVFEIYGNVLWGVFFLLFFSSLNQTFTGCIPSRVKIEIFLGSH